MKLSVLNHAWRGARLLNGFVRGQPMHAIIQVSNLCNLSCGFCSFWENPADKRHEMRLEDIEVISSKLSEGGSMVVSIEGGEPLLRPDIVGIVRAFSRYHHPIMFTNGRSVREKISQDLWDAGLDTVGISIDYANADAHDRHRGRKGTFELATRAIDILRDTAPRGAKQVFVMTVVMDENVEEIEPLLQLSAAHGVNHQITLISTAGAGRHRRAQDRPMLGASAKLLRLKEKYPHFITFTGYLEGIERALSGQLPTPCHAGVRFLNIDHMGDVSPCIEKLQLRTGNLIRDPWSVVYPKLRSLEEPKTCTDCFTSCRGFVDEMSGVPKLRSYREFFRDFSG